MDARSELASSSMKSIIPATTTNARHQNDVFFDGNNFAVQQSASKLKATGRGVSGLSSKAVASILTRKFSSPSTYDDPFRRK